MIETDVLTALQTAAIAARDDSSVPLMPIKAIGRTFTIPDDNKYLEFVNIVNNGADNYYGDERVYQGNFRIILHWENDDAGAYPPSGYLDEIASFFTKEKTFISGQATVKIYQNPSASGMISSGSELLFPLTLPYRCFRP